MASYSAQFLGPSQIHNSGTSAFNEGIFGYHTNLQAQLRGEAQCLGTGPGQWCEYTGLRRTIAPDPHLYLYNRAYHRSSDAPTPLTTCFPDTLNTPLNLNEDQKRILNKGDSLMSYDTRQWDGNTALKENEAIFFQHMAPNHWRDSFTWMPSAGTNVDTRVAALDLAASKQDFLRGQFRSYGVYGVVNAAARC